MKRRDFGKLFGLSGLALLAPSKAKAFDWREMLFIGEDDITMHRNKYQPCFSEDGFIYATNGRIIIRVPGECTIERYSDYTIPPIDKWKAQLATAGKLPSIEFPKPERINCIACNGVGSYGMAGNVCEACDGDRYHCANMVINGNHASGVLVEMIGKLPNARICLNTIRVTDNKYFPHVFGFQFGSVGEGVFAPMFPERKKNA